MVCNIYLICFNKKGECKPGYRADASSGTLKCAPINMCTDNTDSINDITATQHLCHMNATCEYTGPGQYQCKCQEGFEGDGWQC